MNVPAECYEDLPESLLKLEPRIIEMVCNEIIDSSGRLAWEDIAGLDHVKRLVAEMVVWPMLNPHLFKGVRAPPKGLLLFGPPGASLVVNG